MSDQPTQPNTSEDMEKLAYLQEITKLILPDAPGLESEGYVRLIVDKCSSLIDYDFTQQTEEIRDEFESICYAFIPFFVEDLTDEQVIQFYNYKDEQGNELGKQLLELIIDNTTPEGHRGSRNIIERRIRAANGEI